MSDSCHVIQEGMVQTVDLYADIRWEAELKAWMEFHSIVDAATDFTDGGVYVDYLKLEKLIDEKIAKLSE